MNRGKLGYSVFGCNNISLESSTWCRSPTFFWASNASTWPSVILTRDEELHSAGPAASRALHILPRSSQNSPFEVRYHNFPFHAFHFSHFFLPLFTRPDCVTAEFDFLEENVLTQGNNFPRKGFEGLKHSRTFFCSKEKDTRDEFSFAHMVEFKQFLTSLDNIYNYTVMRSRQTVSTWKRESRTRTDWRFSRFWFRNLKPEAIRRRDMFKVAN